MCIPKYNIPKYLFDDIQYNIMNYTNVYTKSRRGLLIKNIRKIFAVIRGAIYIGIYY